MDKAFIVINFLLFFNEKCFCQNVPEELTLISACEKHYSTISGGQSFEFLLTGFRDSVNYNDYELEIEENRNQLITEKTQCSKRDRTFIICPSPSLEMFDNLVLPLTILPCRFNRTEERFCYTVYSNGTVAGRNEPILNLLDYGLIYHDNPKIASASRDPTNVKTLIFQGSNLLLWSQVCRHHATGKPTNPYTIKWGDYDCLPIWDKTTNSTITCDTYLVPSDQANVTLSLGSEIIFTTFLAAPVIQAKENQVNRLLPLIIILPTVFLIAAIVVFVVCWIRYQRRNKPLLPYVPMQTINVFLRFDELPENLRNEVEPHRIDENTVNIGSHIGSGHFGEVKRAIWKTSSMPVGKLVAVKFFKNSRKQSDLEDFLREAAIMCRLHHENVLECYGIYFPNDYREAAIVVPYMENSDLRSYVIQYTFEIGMSDIIDLATQICKGMDYLSKNGFVHRDLAARNCLINNEKVVKVADFGMSRNLVDSDYYAVESVSNKPLPIRWMAPESLQTGRFTCQTDVWSFGIVLWELCTKGGFPYDNIRTGAEVRERLIDRYIMDRSEDIPVSFYKVMTKCWQYQPKDRPSFFQLISILDNLKDTFPGGGHENYIDVDQEDSYTLPNQLTNRDRNEDDSEEDNYIDNGDGNGDVEYNVARIEGEYQDPVNEASNQYSVPNSPGNDNFYYGINNSNVSNAAYPDEYQYS